MLKIGNHYTGLIIRHGNKQVINQDLQALLYENGRLLLASSDRKYYVFVSGHIAACWKKIKADRFDTAIRFTAPVTAQTDAMRLKDKCPYIPPRLIDAIIKGVTG